jgi:hypothetical protein
LINDRIDATQQVFSRHSWLIDERRLLLVAAAAAAAAEIQRHKFGGLVITRQG